MIDIYRMHIVNLITAKVRINCKEELTDLWLLRDYLYGTIYSNINLAKIVTAKYVHIYKYI